MEKKLEFGLKIEKIRARMTHSKVEDLTKSTRNLISRITNGIIYTSVNESTQPKHFSV